MWMGERAQMLCTCSVLVRIMGGVEQHTSHIKGGAFLPSWLGVADGVVHVTVPGVGGGGCIVMHASLLLRCQATIACESPLRHPLVSHPPPPPGPQLGMAGRGAIRCVGRYTPPATRCPVMGARGWHEGAW